MNKLVYKQNTGEKEKYNCLDFINTAKTGVFYLNEAQEVLYENVTDLIKDSLEMKAPC